MDPKLVSALVAGVVALLVSLVSLAYQKKRLVSEEKRSEREEIRRVTERLYDMRLAAYPKAYEITRSLLSHEIEQTGLTRELLSSVRHELVDWAPSDASFILSRKSRRSFHVLRQQLDEALKLDNTNITDQVKLIRKARGPFRRNLRRDLRLLFLEDERFPEDDGQDDEDA